MPDFFFPRVRRRTTFSDGVTGQSRASGVGSFTAYDIPGRVTEECIDETHNWDPRSADTLGDVGGPFQLIRTEQTFPTTYRLNNAYCVGTVGAKPHSAWSSPFGGLGLITGNALNAFGTTAIARTTPTSPVSGLATALGELRSDGLPRLPGAEARATTLSARSAGSEYLNVEFGWLPLVSDIRKFAYAVKHANAIISAYQKGSDKKIRKRWGIPSDSQSAVGSGGGFLSPSDLNIVTQVTVSETAVTSRSFSGAYRYHIPMGDSQAERFLRYESYSNRLLGTRITPEVLWNVAPWTWAVDWFTNAGDVIHNISALGSDGLVLQYGYATDVVDIVTRTSATCLSNGKGVPAGLVLDRLDRRKYIKRVAANPYGFGITDLSLTTRQTAILAALGLTRGQRQHPRG